MYSNLATIDENGVAHSRFATYSYECDRYNQARLSFYFSIIQEAAGIHAALRGLSITDMLAQSKTWVITRNTTVVHRYAQWGEVVTVQTWPAQPIRLHLPRIIEGYDSEGELLFSSTTLWAILDTENGRPQRPQHYSERMIIPSGVEERYPTELSLPKPLTLDEHFILLQKSAITITYGDTDRNRHVNNISYLNWALEGLPAPFRDTYNAIEVDVSYARQTFLGDTLSVTTWAQSKEAWQAQKPNLFHRIIRTEEDGSETTVWEGSSKWALRDVIN
jgi:medium-chain acyl-[acyl-carrier-protein] hydrolase